MKKLILVTILFFTTSTPSIANEEPIDEMFRIMSMETQLTGGFEAMLPLIDQMSNRFKLDKEAKEELKEIFRTWFQEDIDQDKMLSEFKSLYKATFTDTEIVQITDFYKTPVGQKLVKQSPELVKIAAKMGMQEAQSKQSLLQERIKPFLKKHKADK